MSKRKDHSENDTSSGILRSKEEDLDDTIEDAEEYEDDEELDKEEGDEEEKETDEEVENEEDEDEDGTAAKETKSYQSYAPYEYFQNYDDACRGK